MVRKVNNYILYLHYTNGKTMQDQFLKIYHPGETETTDLLTSEDAQKVANHLIIHSIGYDALQSDGEGETEISDTVTPHEYRP